MFTFATGRRALVSALVSLALSGAALPARAQDPAPPEVPPVAAPAPPEVAVPPALAADPAPAAPVAEETLAEPVEDLHPGGIAAADAEAEPPVPPVYVEDPAIHRNGQPRVEFGAKLIFSGLERPTYRYYSNEHGAETNNYGGAGLLLRVRASHFIAVELDAAALHGTDDSWLNRDLLQLDANLLVYFVHSERFELYGLFGLGSTMVRWSDSADTTYGEDGAFNLATGLGAQLVLNRHFRLFGEMKLGMVAPTDDDEYYASRTSDKPYYLRDPGSSQVYPDYSSTDPFFSPSMAMGVTFGF